MHPGHPRMTVEASLPWLVMAWVAVAGCGAGAQTALDASVDRAAPDVPPLSDAGPKPLALDFSATGCSMFDLLASRCEGTAPLTLTFTPIASEELTRFLWTFGDDTAFSSERSPTHTYAVTGLFDVMLSAGGDATVGSVQQSHAGYINVKAAPAGALCDVDQQCEQDLGCWCGSATPCAPVLTRGFCGRRCDAEAGGPSSCPPRTACADLSAPVAAPPPAGTPTATIPWRRPLCLATCTTDADCAAGLRCRDLLDAGAPAGGWVRACFAAYPLELGARCGDAAGVRVDADCASRSCADLGTFGRCSANCAMVGCPTGSACAHFGDGRNLCLAACTGSSACNDDPLLSCEAPGAPGALGFTVAGTTTVPGAPARTFCAPRRCAAAADCGVPGTCPVGGGHCARTK